jgi:hypothetical protein
MAKTKEQEAQEQRKQTERDKANEDNKIQERASDAAKGKRKPWKDKEGRKHKANCNAHPDKKIRGKCDCGAMLK